jgi:hypothetical protein
MDYSHTRHDSFEHLSRCFFQHTVICTPPKGRSV